MRRATQATLAVTLSLALGVLSPAAEAGRGYGRHHHGWHRGHHASFGLYFGHPWGWGPRPWYRSHFGPYPPAYFPAQTIIVEREPPVYVQRQAPAAPAPTAQPWYYCPNPSGYYPHVPSCTVQWVPVDPRSLPPVTAR